MAENEQNTGTCNYCAQVIETFTEGETSDQRNETATLKCDCKEAKTYQDEKHQEEVNEANLKLSNQMLDNLFKLELKTEKEEGETTELQDKLEFVDYVAKKVAKRIIPHVAIKISKEIHVSVFISTLKKNEGKLIIRRHENRNRQVEI